MNLLRTTHADVPGGYKRTEVGVIPEDWEVLTFREQFSISAGGDVKSQLTSSEQDEVHRFPIYSNALTAKGLYGFCSYADHPADSVTITARGTLGVATYRDHRYTAIGRVLVLEPKAESAGQFFAEFINSRVKFAIESTGVPQLTAPQIGSYSLAVPPLAEQRAIAEALNDVDALLESLNRLIAKKRDVKQGTMQRLLTGQTRLPGFDGAWEVRRLGDLAALNRFNVLPALQPDKLFVHFSLPAFDAGRNAQLDLGSAIGSNKFGVPETAVLVSKLNPRIPRIWAPPSIPENAVASTEWLVLTPKAEFDRQYLYMLCSSPTFCEQMELSATGTTGSHQRISPRTALDIRINVTTDQHEQRAIAAVLADMDAEIEALEARREKTRLLKQGMMQELLTGRRRLV